MRYSVASLAPAQCVTETVAMLSSSDFDGSTTTNG